MKIQEMKEQIFGGILFLSNRLELIIDRYLAESGLTTRQWMLMVILSKNQNQPMSLGTIAKEMSTSHQNTKQIALKLQKNGWLNIEKDPKDSRILRLSLTKKCTNYWKKREKENSNYISNLLPKYKDKEIHEFHEYLFRLFQKIQDQDKQ